MAFVVNFGKSDKRINSTEIPEVSESATCVLKSGTSVENPTFILQGVSPFDWNVAYCETFGRYYFINNVTYVESTYEISCTCDYLASYKDEILNNTAYVERIGTFSERNPFIIDTILPTSCKPNIMTASAALATDQTGCIIICTAGKSGNGFIVLTVANFNRLCSYLYTAEYTTGLNDFLQNPDGVAKEVARPQDYLLSATWIPFAPPGGTPVNVVLGYVDTGIPGWQIATNNTFSKSVSLAVPRTEQMADAKYPFLRFAPYAHYMLQVPFYGTIPLNPNLIGDTLLINYTIDISGGCDISIFSGATLVASLNGNCGVPVGYSARQTNIIGTSQVELASAVQFSDSAQKSFSSAASVDAIGAASNFINATAAIGSGIMSGLQASVPRVSNSGGSGSIYVNNLVYLVCEYYQLVETNLFYQGYPCCKFKTLNSISGFVKCKNANIKCNATADGTAAIINYLNGGMFIE